MKTDTTNKTLNKLLSYAFDNLMLDALDETYTLNRLAALCGVKAPTRDEDADYGDSTLDELLGELPENVDKTAVKELLFPLPHTVNYYFADTLARNAGKAFDFLFDLYAQGGYVCKAPSYTADGFVCYSDCRKPELRAVTLDDLVYTPRTLGGRTALLDKPDVLADDVVTREMNFVLDYGHAIAARVSGSVYHCFEATALTAAKTKKELKSGAVKVSALDYPVPALAFGGIAKNSVAREVVRVLKAADEADLPCVVCAAPKDGVTFYIVFANKTEKDATGMVLGGDELAACGVVETVNFKPLLPVLEKGTALSTDLAAFKPIYDTIGGVKLGAKAEKSLAEALVKLYKPVLAAAASADEAKAAALLADRE